MHIADIIIIFYIAAWILGGILLLRDIRSQPVIARLMALIAVLLGPFGILLYAGFRYIADEAATRATALQPKQKRTIIDA